MARSKATARKPKARNEIKGKFLYFLYAINTCRHKINRNTVPSDECQCSIYNCMHRILGGRVKKLEQDTAKDKMALKIAAKRTPSSLQEQKQENKKFTPRPISKVNKHTRGTPRRNVIESKHTEAAPACRPSFFPPE